MPIKKGPFKNPTKKELGAKRVRPPKGSTPMGRPKKTFSPEQVNQIKTLCSMQCTKSEVCAVMDVDHETLDRIFSEDLGTTFSDFFARYQEHGKVDLRRMLFRKARKDHFGAMKWLSKQHLGMTEKIAQKIEVEDKRVVTVDLSWADEPNPGNETPGQDASPDPATKKV